MEVVREQAPSEDLEIVPLLELSQEVEKCDRFLRIGKHFLAPREPVVDVVQPAFDQNPRRSWNRDPPSLTLSQDRLNRLTWLQ
jgi:hypothetical protein